MKDSISIAEAMPAEAGQVEEKLCQTKSDRVVCQIVSTFRHMRSHVAGACTPDMAISDAKLRKLGILLPVDKIQRPSSHRDLMRQAGESEICTKRF